MAKTVRKKLMLFKTEADRRSGILKKFFDKANFKLIILIFLLIFFWTGASNNIVNAIALPVAGFGNALDFSTNRIDIPNNDETRLAGDSDFTVSMWIFPEAEEGFDLLL